MELEKELKRAEEEIGAKYLELKEKMQKVGIDLEDSCSESDLVAIRREPYGSIIYKGEWISVYIPEVELRKALPFANPEMMRKAAAELGRLAEIAEEVKDLVNDIIELDKKIHKLKRDVELEKERKLKEVFEEWPEVLRRWEFREDKVVELRKGAIGRGVGTNALKWYPCWYINGVQFYLSDYITRDGRILSKRAQEELGLGREHIKILLAAEEEFNRKLKSVL